MMALMACDVLLSSCAASKLSTAVSSDDSSAVGMSSNLKTGYLDSVVWGTSSKLKQKKKLTGEPSGERIMVTNL
jgi:hypothetical protein